MCSLVCRVATFWWLRFCSSYALTPNVNINHTEAKDGRSAVILSTLIRKTTSDYDSIFFHFTMSVSTTDRLCTNQVSKGVKQPTRNVRWKFYVNDQNCSVQYHGPLRKEPVVHARTINDVCRPPQSKTADRAPRTCTITIKFVQITDLQRGSDSIYFTRVILFFTNRPCILINIFIAQSTVSYLWATNKIFILHALYVVSVRNNFATGIGTVLQTITTKS